MTQNGTWSYPGYEPRSLCKRQHFYCWAITGTMLTLEGEIFPYELLSYQTAARKYLNRGAVHSLPYRWVKTIHFMDCSFNMWIWSYEPESFIGSIPPSDVHWVLCHSPALSKLFYTSGLAAVWFHPVILLFTVKVPTQASHLPLICVWENDLCVHNTQTLLILRCSHWPRNPLNDLNLAFSWCYADSMLYLLCCFHQTLLTGRNLLSGRCAKNAPWSVDLQ